MSGILAIVHTDGSAVPQETLSGLTESMRFRGPDAIGTWAAGCVGMGHTLLQTVDDTLPDRQPLGLPGHNGHQLHITAHARVDAQAELRRKLRHAGQQVPGNATDAQLILHAYAVWGQNCLDHLIGDFCFAIWDSLRHELFCARDHFGIRPLYYAEVHGRLVIGNTIQTIRLHPDLPKDVDDVFVADFLMFGGCPEPLRTPYAVIRRLAPGHCLIWSERRGVSIQKYWQLPDYGAERFREAGDYVDAFRDVLQTAIKDRLRTSNVGVQLSGGMDSTSIAATIRLLLERTSKPYSLQGLCATTNHLIRDEERPLAEIVAQHLQIPLHLFSIDSFRLMQPAAADSRLPWQPGGFGRLAETTAMQGQAASLSRVWLTGWDGDAVLSESIRPRLNGFTEKRQFGKLIAAVWSLVWHQGGLSARAWIHDLQRRTRDKLQSNGSMAAAHEPCYPDWLDSELENRLDLQGRWREFHSKNWKPVFHPTRPYAYTLLTNMSADARLYEDLDPCSSGHPLEYRHPLMDLRLIELCLTLPLQPWVVKKHILRECMKGQLPAVVLKRPKTPLAENLNAALLSRDAPGLPHWHYDKKLLTKYVKICTLEPQAALKRRHSWSQDPAALQTDLLLYELQRWVQTLPYT